MKGIEFLSSIKEELLECQIIRDSQGYRCYSCKTWVYKYAWKNNGRNSIQHHIQQHKVNRFVRVRKVTFEMNEGKN